MLKSIKEKPLWVNLLVAIILVAILVFVFFASLAWITNHGKVEKVPNITGQNFVAAKKILEDKGFKVEIGDSVFVDSIARQSVVRQFPEADATVKAGRTVYLTVNRTIAPLIDMPNFVGFSIKSSMLMLQSLNLKLGDTTFRPDISKNAVLEQLFNGKKIEPGTKIPMGSTISFVLGSGLGVEMDVPDLVGLTVQEAKNVLAANQIEFSSIIAKDLSEKITDTANSFVVEQRPAAYYEPYPGQKVRSKLRAGQFIDIKIGLTKPEKIDSTGSTPTTSDY